MLNSTKITMGSNSQTVQFNAPCTGILQRSHPKSKFIRFQKGSEMEKMIFPSNETSPYLTKSVYPHDKIEIEVLQILIFGDNYYLCEVIQLTDLINND